MRIPSLFRCRAQCCTLLELASTITGFSELFVGHESQQIADWYPEMCACLGMSVNHESRIAQWHHARLYYHAHCLGDFLMQ
jgi:hypothetical protein